MQNEISDGFDHTVHQAEVEQRWGKAAYADGDKWWRSMSAEDREAFKARQNALISDWQRAASAGISPESDEAQALASRQAKWLMSIPGTPGYGLGEVPSAYIQGLAEMYVADERFAANYGGVQGAIFVRDAIIRWLRNRHNS